MVTNTNTTWDITENGDTVATVISGGNNLQLSITGSFDGASLQLKSKIGGQDFQDIGLPLTENGRVGRIFPAQSETFKITVTGGGASIDLKAALVQAGR